MVDKRLKGMLARIFADSVVEAAERKELDALLASLSKEVVRETMIDFLSASMKHVLADGKISDREKEKLRVMVMELELPNDCIPDEVRRAIA
jgi:hypothetical protein